MRHILWSSSVLLLVLAMPLWAQVAGKRPAASKTAAAPVAAAPSAEEKAIRAVADAYVKAYNAHDAKAVAALFTPDAQGEKGVRTICLLRADGIALSRCHDHAPSHSAAAKHK
jgi:hypothetical protein